MTAIRTGTTTGRRSPGLSAAIAIALSIAAPAATAGDVARMEGTLTDGVPWQIVMPENWNGTLLVDLDFNTSQERYAPLYALGYAGAGINRLPFEQGGRNAPIAAERIMTVLDTFEKEYGKPEVVIANGRSSGAVLSAYLVENYPERIDGATAQCTVPGYIPSYNSKLDAAFATKHLLGVDLAIDNIPTDKAAFEALVNGWSEAITAAQQTPEGKARVALAHAIGQLPVWSNPDAPIPDPSDPDALQQAMFETLHGQFHPVQGSRLGVRRSFEIPAGGGWSWNTGVDYAKIFSENVRPQEAAVVAEFYSRAGLDLAADLAMLNDAPRITGDSAAIENIHNRGAHTANPDKPILINLAIGDAVTAAAATESYVARARQNGKQDLVRVTFVEGAGHCGFTQAEYMAVIEALHERVRTGQWPDTSPAAMNARTRALDPASEAHFIDHEFAVFARPFFAGDPLPK